MTPRNPITVSRRAHVPETQGPDALSPRNQVTASCRAHISEAQSPALLSSEAGGPPPYCPQAEMP